MTNKAKKCDSLLIFNEYRTHNSFSDDTFDLFSKGESLLLLIDSIYIVRTVVIVLDNSYTFDVTLYKKANHIADI